MNKIDDEFQYDDNDFGIIILDNSHKKTNNNLPKKFSNPVVSFENPNEEDDFKSSNHIFPDTLYSPKDKVSNLTWNNKLPIGEDIGVTSSRNKCFYGCVVHLDYEKIINSPDVVTGAQLSHFDRTVYDAIVTLYIAGNDTFSTHDIWRIVSQNPKAQITSVTRQKIIRSMFHITKFWMTIVTDDSDKFLTWCSLRKDKPYESERKLYKKLQATYTGRLLDFRVIGNITFDVTYNDNGRQFTEKQSFPEVWKILATPILYEYAEAKHQVSAVPIKLISTAKSEEATTTVRRGSRTDELTGFLSREIDTMKKTVKRKQPYSRFILFERIYQIDGINDIEQNADNIKLKKSRTRDKLKKILNRFKENGMIRGLNFIKKLKANLLLFIVLKYVFKTPRLFSDNGLIYNC